MKGSKVGKEKRGRDGFTFAWAYRPTGGATTRSSGWIAYNYNNNNLYL